MKKLNDIYFTKTDVYKHISSSGWSFTPVLANLTGIGLAVHTYQYSFHLTTNIIEAYHDESERKKMTKRNLWWRFRNQAVCDYSGDTATLIMAFEHLNGKPDAQKALWHYFTGNGEVIEVDTGRVIREDNDFKINVLKKIAAQKNEGKKNGRVDIQQKEFSSDSNWQNTFGAVFVQWTLRLPFIDLWIENSEKNAYQWHPDAPRHSQCVHKAMVEAQKYGARNFRFEGTKYSISVKDLENLAK